MKPCYIQPAPWHTIEDTITGALSAHGVEPGVARREARDLATPLLAACRTCPIRAKCEAARPKPRHGYGYTGVWAGRLLHDGHDITRPAKGEAA